MFGPVLFEAHRIDDELAEGLAVGMAGVALELLNRGGVVAHDLVRHQARLPTVEVGGCGVCVCVGGGGGPGVAGG